MTLEQMAAQMLVLGEEAYPFGIPLTTKRLIRDLGIGGVFLQTMNALFPGPALMSDLTNELNSLAMSGEHAIPLLFSIDQEGGTTQAWPSVFGGTDSPGNMALGALDDPVATFDMYAMMGREIRAFGANVAYSPEFDLVVSPDAAWIYTKGFGESGPLAARHAPAAIRGFQSELIMGAMKHFPAGGCVFEDTHNDSPTCEMTKAELVATHLAPFIAAVDAGADMVMVSPVIYPALDPDFPAALSAKVKIDYLRGELGFDGLISTGDMGMPPFQHDWGVPKEVLAAKSGADLQLYVFEVATYRDAVKIVGNIADAVRNGEIPADRFAQSIARILRHKQKYCLFEQPYTDSEQAEAVNGTEENLAMATPIIAGSITLIRNDLGIWPMEQTDGAGLLVISPMRTMLYEPASGFAMLTGTTLAKQVKKLAPLSKSAQFMPGSFSFFLTDAVSQAADPSVEQIIIGTFNAHYEPEQSQMVRDVIALGKPTLVLAIGAPFDLLSFPEATTYLAVYNIRDLALTLAAQTIFGMHDPLGRLPVTLPGLYNAGHSAYQNAS
jgi:beta-N-acetylhexosaminidase